MYVYIYIYVHVSECGFANIHARIFINMCIYMRVCMYTYIYIHVHTINTSTQYDARSSVAQAGI